MVDIEFVKLNKARRLRAIADELINLHPIETRTFKFNTRSLNPESPSLDLVNEISDWEKAQKFTVVYYFSLSKDADPEIVHKKISDAKKRKFAKRAYPRVNPPSRCLYVGGSRDIAKRVKEHLGFGNRKTYAMNIAFWCRNLNLDIDIVCMCYEPKISKEVIQAFEDGLWEHFKPLLGRKGAR